MTRLIVMGLLVTAIGGCTRMMLVGDEAGPDSDFAEAPPRVFTADLDAVTSEVTLALALVGAPPSGVEPRSDGSTRIDSQPMTARRGDGLDCGEDLTLVGSGNPNRFIPGEISFQISLHPVEGGTRVTVTEVADPGCVPTGRLATRILDQIAEALSRNSEVPQARTTTSP